MCIQDKLWSPIQIVYITQRSALSKFNLLSPYRSFFLGKSVTDKYNNTGKQINHHRKDKEEYKLRNVLRPATYKNKSNQMSSNYNNTENNNDNNTSNDGYSSLGKRARFMNLVKNTKDTYFPVISQSFKNSTSTVWDYNKNSPSIQNYKEFPNDLQLIFYPTYIASKFGGFETRVRFSLQSPGNITSRKNRLLVALSKQYLKPGPNAPTPTIVSSSSSDDCDSSAIDMENGDDTLSGSTATMSRNDLESSYTPVDTDGNELSVLKERLTGFITKSVGNIPLTINLYNANEEEFITSIQSNSKGHVDEKFRTDFLPTNVKISLDHNQSLEFTMDMTENYPITFIKPGGVAIISDIDDTIKHTGITGDKRSMFRNVFVHDIESWSIKGIPEWYNNLKSLYDADFFYVSNSPMQLYSVLNDFITRFLPTGPMFLKQYSGNLLSGIMTSSANRKLNSIKNIVSDFPNKKFILIGDSGEQDLEAYISTAIQYPDQIVAIYIRCCKNSMSDMGLNESEVVNELNDLVHQEYAKPFEAYMSNEQELSVSPSLPTRPSVPKKNFNLTKNQMDSIKLSKLNIRHDSNDKNSSDPCLSKVDSSMPGFPQSRSTPPASSSPSAPSSPQELYIHNTIPAMKRRVPPPPLPFHLDKPHTDTELVEAFNKYNQSRSGIYHDNNIDTKPAHMMPSSQNDHNTYSGYFDKKAEMWNRRVKQSIKQLNDIGKYDLGIMFFSDPNLAEKDSIAHLDDIKR